MRRSLQVSLIAVFAALHAALYFISFGLWRNWGTYLEPIEGIILGLGVGFFAALIGSSIGRMVKPDGFWMFGVWLSLLAFDGWTLAKAKWKPVLIAYLAMLVAYFIHPYGRDIPFWTI